MSDDIFEGDNNSLDQQDFLDAMDLFSVSNASKHLWKLPERSNLHVALFLMITKGLPHAAGQKIMDRIEQAIGKKDMSHKNFTFSDKKMKQWGLSAEKISGIRKILTLDEINPNTLCKVKEGGIYLIKGFRVLADEDDDTFWESSFQVRYNMGRLLGHSKILPEQDARNLGKKWLGYRSQISYFFYRIKPDAMEKIVNEEELTADDFF